MGVLLNTLAVLVIGCFSLAASAGDGKLQIQDPWVRAAPPTVKVLAAYFALTNKDDAPRKIVRVSSPAFERVEIHRSIMQGDMAHMAHHEELTIPPNETVTLKPGELHLMLIGARKPLHRGDSVPITLSLQNGEEVIIHAPVRPDGMGGMDHSKHMH
ncbi:MAG: copper chaperone PCu(A)C [Gammaproteobacteria bacterium]|nr:copper chaperone PCu(A)C [Gammaproteobacteria bacterium]